MIDWLRQRLGLMTREKELEWLHNLEIAVQTSRALVIAAADAKTKIHALSERIDALEAKITSWEKMY